MFAGDLLLVAVILGIIYGILRLVIALFFHVRKLLDKEHQQLLADKEELRDQLAQLERAVAREKGKQII